MRGNGRHRPKRRRLVIAACLVAALAMPGAGGAEGLAVEWVDIPAPGGKTIRAAVARPPSGAQAPLVILLHGTAGWYQDEVDLAELIAAKGFVVVSGCWFKGNYMPANTGGGQVTNLPCDNGPDFVGSSLAALPNVSAMIAFGKALAGVDPTRVGVIGQSRGGSMTALAATLAEVGAAVGIDGPQAFPKGMSDDFPAKLATQIRAPLLLVHGTADGTVPVLESVVLEARLRALRKPVEGWYPAGWPHTFIYANEAARRDETVARAAAFFTKAFSGGVAVPTKAPAYPADALPVPLGAGLATAVAVFPARGSTQTTPQLPPMLTGNFPTLAANLCAAERSALGAAAFAAAHGTAAACAGNRTAELPGFVARNVMKPCTSVAESGTPAFMNCIQTRLPQFLADEQAANAAAGKTCTAAQKTKKQKAEFARIYGAAPRAQAFCVATVRALR